MVYTFTRIPDVRSNTSNQDTDGPINELQAAVEDISLQASVGAVAVTGLTTDGTGDNTTVLLAAITAIQTAGGGELRLPYGTIRCDGQLLIPNDGATNPLQKPIAIVGAGSSKNTMPISTVGSGIPNGGTILDLRYSGANPAKIDTRGAGLLAIRNLSITDKSATPNSKPFIQTTNTVLHIEDVAFYGNPARSGATCDQDAIVLGGTTTELDGTATAAFQGYGTVIEDCHFGRIRQGVLMRTFCNGVVIQDNTWWADCGAGSAAYAAINLQPGAQSVFGNLIQGNLIEMASYYYGILCDYAQGNNFIANNFYDPGGTALAYIRFASINVIFNTVVCGYGDHLTHVSEQTVGQNLILSGHSNQEGCFPRRTRFYGPIVADGSSVAGGINVDFNGGATGSVFKTAGTIWARQGVGGSLKIDTGSGGSNFDITAYSIRLYDHTGALRLTLMAATDGIKFGSTSDTNLYRLAADHLKTDDKFLAVGGVGVGNSAAATTLGTVAKKMEVFDATGASLGFVPIYDAIT